MALIVSNKIKAKLLLKHQVTVEEVIQAFADRPDYVVEDEREDHKSDPPTVWFVASTDRGRMLKVAYIQRGDDIYLRTAHPAKEAHIRLFNAAV
jgi:uncharacterized DUF497 family protein